jgi:peptidoglycan/LPS O-acetylase OafA/YrhL
VSKETWTTLIYVASALIVVGAVWLLFVVRPRWKLALPFAVAFAVSAVIYGTSTDGADSFHRNFVISALAALAIGGLSPAPEPDGEGRLASVAWALFGIVAPVALVLGTLTVACWGQTDCFG